MQLYNSLHNVVQCNITQRGDLHTKKMTSHMTDAEIDEILREQYYYETEILERALASCSPPPEPENPEKIHAEYERLVARLKSKGIWRE